MTTDTASPTATAARVTTDRQRLPLAGLLALATAVFITCLTEVMPAGLLPAMSGSLRVGASAMGQSVTVYAIGTALTALPLTAATAGWSRRRLLLTAMATFAVANTLTAVALNYPVAMVGRFLAGVAAGLAWSLLAGYARRMAPEALQGRAIAIAMAGIPVALSLGVPAGTFLGRAVGWRWAFLSVSVLAVLLIGWILLAVPDHPGQRAGARLPMRQAVRLPGVAAVLGVTLTFVLAHTILYTFIAPFLGRLGLGNSVGLVLLVFGAASLVSISITGAQIGRRLRTLMIGATLLVGAAAALLAVSSGSTALVYLAAALWGLGWGGVPTLLQTAGGNAGGAAADSVMAMLVTLWNGAMAGGGAVGGVLLGALGTLALPWTVVVLLAPALGIVLATRAHGFPERRG
ncbi:MFS transporter [Kitasatospora acidiphila]|uniref:MFS transporter n=1 Tax=Kitasatospora acidiphila TaxID=2567942 RepID=UPI003C75C987